MSETKKSAPPELSIRRESEKPWVRTKIYFQSVEQAVEFVKEFWQTAHPGYIERNFKPKDTESEFYQEQHTEGDRTEILRCSFPDDKRKGVVYVKLMGNNQPLTREAVQFITNKGDSITKITSDV